MLYLWLVISGNVLFLNFFHKRKSNWDDQELAPVLRVEMAGYIPVMLTIILYYLRCI
jgi:hypothetical protein